MAKNISVRTAAESDDGSAGVVTYKSDCNVRKIETLVRNPQCSKLDVIAFILLLAS